VFSPDDGDAKCADDEIEHAVVSARVTVSHLVARGSCATKTHWDLSSLGNEIPQVCPLLTTLQPLSDWPDSFAGAD
jgi:hypothetical protein